MVNRKAEKTTPRRNSKTRVESEKQVQNADNSGVNYLKLGESYTSLLLGIVVVIISSLLLISFFKSRDSVDPNQNKQEISSIQIGPSITPRLTPVDESAKQVTETPTITPTVTAIPTPTHAPTVTKMPNLTATPTLTKVTPTPTSMPTPTPTKVVQKTNEKAPSSYTTVSGDSLWSIAEKVYNDGYKWTEIAKLNNLSNPNMLYAGTKLSLPQTELKTTIAQTKPSQTEVTTKPTVTGKMYTVVKGDDLWDVAVKVYGNGYRWIEIAKANNLTNPNVIHAGNILKIPR